eukprot:s49_g90.t1
MHFGGESLGEQLEQSFKRPVPPVSGVEDSVMTADVSKKPRIPDAFVSKEPHFRTCVKNTDDVTWQEQREAQLQRALKHWLVLIETWEPENDFVQCVLGCDSSNSQLIMLGDVFRGKAPSTLTKRANSMRILCEQLQLVGLKFPCSESTLYGILCELRRRGHPPSRSKGILEAIAFTRYTMGSVECDSLLKGRRCWGAATIDEPLNRNQASPLRVKELEKLHSILAGSADRWDKLFAGMTLFVIYARARWSDAQHSANLVFDRHNGRIHYAEAVTGLHKSVRALQFRHQFLPLIAPSIGITSDNWAEQWETARMELGVDIKQGFALMPAPLEDGSPGKRALDSKEAGKWLRALLELDETALQDRKVSSHSMKCTMLSYLAKRGVEMPDRLLLGYHTSPFTMGLTYSRDAMARPLQILENMLGEIRMGHFMPDCTRSGRLVRSSGVVTAPGFQGTPKDTVVKVEISDDEDEPNVWNLITPAAGESSLPEVIPDSCENEMNDACTETSGSDLSESEDDRSGFEKRGKRTFEPPVAPEGYTMWQHSKSKILHLSHCKTPNVFECGRRPGVFHVCQDIHPRWDSGICWKCFKHR